MKPSERIHQIAIESVRPCADDVEWQQALILATIKYLNEQAGKKGKANELLD